MHCLTVTIFLFRTNNKMNERTIAKVATATGGESIDLDDPDSDVLVPSSSSATSAAIGILKCFVCLF